MVPEEKGLGFLRRRKVEDKVQSIEVAQLS